MSSSLWERLGAQLEAEDIHESFTPSARRAAPATTAVRHEARALPPQSFSSNVHRDVRAEPEPPPASDFFRRERELPRARGRLPSVESFSAPHAAAPDVPIDDGPPLHLRPAAPGAGGVVAPVGLRYIPPPKAPLLGPKLPPPPPPSLAAKQKTGDAKGAGGGMTRGGRPAPTRLPGVTVTESNSGGRPSAITAALAAAPKIFSADDNDMINLAVESGAVAPDAWPCRVCTFHNHEDLPECEVCGTTRPAILPSASPEAVDIFKGAIPKDPIARANFLGKGAEAFAERERKENKKMEKAAREAALNRAKEEEERVAKAKSTAAPPAKFTDAVKEAEARSIAAARAVAETTEKLAVAEAEAAAAAAARAAAVSADAAPVKQKLPFGAKKSTILPSATASAAAAVSVNDPVSEALTAARTESKAAALEAARADTALAAAHAALEDARAGRFASSQGVTSSPAPSSNTGPKGKSGKGATVAVAAEVVDDADIEGISAALSAGAIAPHAWACPTCAFHNDEFMTVCEMCELPCPVKYYAPAEAPTDAERVAAAVAEERSAKEKKKKASAPTQADAAPAVPLPRAAPKAAPKLKVPKPKSSPFTCTTSGCGRMNPGGDECWNCKAPRYAPAPVEKATEVPSTFSTPATGSGTASASIAAPAATSTQKLPAPKPVAAPAKKAEKGYISRSVPSDKAFEKVSDGDRRIIPGTWMHHTLRTGAVIAAVLVGQSTSDANLLSLANNVEQRWRLPRGKANARATVSPVKVAAPSDGPLAVRGAWLIGEMDMSESGYRYFCSPRSFDSFLNMHVLLDCSDGLLRVAEVTDLDSATASGLPKALLTKRAAVWVAAADPLEQGLGKVGYFESEALIGSGSPWSRVRVPLSLLANSSGSSSEWILESWKTPPATALIRLLATLRPFPSESLIPPRSWVAVPLRELGGEEVLVVARVLYFQADAGLYYAHTGKEGIWSSLEHAVILSPRVAASPLGRAAALARLEKGKGDCVEIESDDESNDKTLQNLLDDNSYPCSEDFAPYASDLLALIPVGRLPPKGNLPTIGTPMLADTRLGRFEVTAVRDVNALDGSLSLVSREQNGASYKRAPFSCLGLTPASVLAYASIRDFPDDAESALRPTTLHSQPCVTPSIQPKPRDSRSSSSHFPIGSWVLATTTPPFIGRVSERSAGIVQGVLGVFGMDSTCYTLTVPGTNAAERTGVPGNTLHLLASTAPLALSLVPADRPSCAGELLRLQDKGFIVSGDLPEDCAEQRFWPAGTVFDATADFSQLEVGSSLVGWRPSRSDFCIATITSITHMVEACVSWERHAADDTIVIAGDSAGREDVMKPNQLVSLTGLLE